MVLCTILLASCTSSQSVKEKLVLDSSQTNEDIIEMYQELINLRQRAIAIELILLEIGQGSTFGLTEARVKLSEARIQLSQFQGKDDIFVKELRNIVQFYREAREQLKMQIDKGEISQMHLGEIDLELLEAKIRLAKAKQ